ncbi:MAG: hypothetical protein LBG12_00560, partial [Synergistaceae bacterium]|nr:hypothetical protein [Synergistaceae bacterium]
MEACPAKEAPPKTPYIVAPPVFIILTVFPVILPGRRTKPPNTRFGCILRVVEVATLISNSLPVIVRTLELESIGDWKKEVRVEFGPAFKPLTPPSYTSAHAVPEPNAARITTASNTTESDVNFRSFRSDASLQNDGN